jgi:hypothetical protein
MTSSKGEESATLGWKGSFLVGCGIGVVLLLVVGLVVVQKAKKVEDAKRQRTLQALMDDAKCLRVTFGDRPPQADGSGADWSGMKTLTAGSEKFEWELVDGWGNPIRYRRPGPIHRHGWDLWSCGPNGKDDQGTFDDIIIGEDVAFEGSH